MGTYQSVSPGLIMKKKKDGSPKYVPNTVILAADFALFCKILQINIFFALLFPF